MLVWYIVIKTNVITLSKETEGSRISACNGRSIHCYRRISAIHVRLHGNERFKSEGETGEAQHVKESSV
jgi:hypothetical protein